MSTSRLWIAILFICGCVWTTNVLSQLEPTPWVEMVDQSLRPQESRLELPGRTLEVATSIDDQNEQSDFIIGQIRFYPRSESDLDDFLATFGGRVVGDNAVSEAALLALGAEGSKAALEPTMYTISLDLDRANLSDLPERARASGITSGLRFSSEAGLRTHALILDAKSAGYIVKPDFLLYPQQMGFPGGARSTFPQSLFESNENSYDAFTEMRFGAGNDQALSNVIPAWQFVAAHGINRRVRLAVIDGGFWVNRPDEPPTTPPTSIDSDIPMNVWQWDIVNKDANVNRPSINLPCAGAPCPSHGTGVAGVAAGIANNGMGRMGTGSLVADLMLIRYSGTPSDKSSALRIAVVSGADVVVISISGRCNDFCLAYEGDIDFSELVEDGSRSVLIASAGNDGRQVDKEGAGLQRPCTEAYVICVGALNDNALTRAIFASGGSSNFGNRVDIFAPTNIPTMSYPDLGGTTSRSNPPFGGTSAAAPFVAGIAAMIKAINPGLGATEVAAILRSTARPGAVSDVTRTVDALAAVRRAAQGIPIVKDRSEGTGVIDFGTATNRTELDLNLDASDRDVFRFTTQQASDVVIKLAYPKDLGVVSVARLIDENPSCRASTLIAHTMPTPPTGAVANAYRQERTYTYRVAAGAHRFVVRADDINAYELSFAVTPATVERDPFEDNNDFEHPTLFGFSWGGWTDRWGFSLGGWTALSAEATIHSGFPDKDVFLVHGVGGPHTSRGGVGFEITNYSGVRISNFESPMTLEVYKQRLDGTPDIASKVIKSGDGCSTKDLIVALEDGRYYFVIVKGKPGRYSIYNGGMMDVQRVNYKNLEDFPRKPGPVEIEELKYFAVLPDPALSAIVSPGQQFQLALIDPATGNRLREAQQIRGGQRLDLARLEPGSVRIVEVKRRTSLANPYGGATAFKPRLETARIARRSVNLIAGGDAETAGEKGDNLSPWSAAHGGPGTFLTTSGLPDRIARGSGGYVFAPGRGMDSGLQQTVHFGPAWLKAIGKGRTKATLAARLGGEGEHSGTAIGRVTFLAADGRDLGSPTALSVGARERQVPALIDVSTESVIPAGAIAARIDLLFQGGGKDNRPMADNISLTLTEFSE